MKLKLFTIAILTIFVVGCAVFQDVYRPPAEPICDKEEFANSSLCKIFRENDLEPEQIHELILDAETLVAGLKPEYYPAIWSFLGIVQSAVENDFFGNLSELFNYVGDFKRKYYAIAIVLSDKINIINVEEVIDPASKKLILMHLEEAKERLRLLGP